VLIKQEQDTNHVTQKDSEDEGTNNKISLRGKGT